MECHIPGVVDHDIVASGERSVVPDLSFPGLFSLETIHDCLPRGFLENRFSGNSFS